MLRVERPGDAARDRAFFDAADLHRNKKSLVLNLQHPKGYTVDQVFADSQVARSRLVREVEHPLWGLVSVLGLPVMLSCTPAQVRTAAPLSGQHTREVLAGLGYDRTAIEGLLADGVVEEAKGAKS
ncbi:MAG: CoA transferase [Candidatus Rokubacteria bacterium]|nr:CoA transferase [Candidatus Rokubacteria bacterium]